MNFDDAPRKPAATKPIFKSDTNELVDVASKLKVRDLKAMMKISDDLARLNYERFQGFRTSGRIPGTKQAALAFNGDVYWGLEAATMDENDLAFAQDHLRILSGLYGLLRPLDAIQPYRLEMGSQLKTARGENLYEFWGDKLAQKLGKDLRSHADQTIVNLASKEYFSAVDKSKLSAKVVTPVFKDEKDGKLRQLQFYSKRARGGMARWVVQNRLDKAENLKKSKVDGYTFNKKLSTGEQWVFTRPQPPKKN